MEGGHSKACLPKLALPWMKQFIVELCSCLSPHLHRVEKDNSCFTERLSRAFTSSPVILARGMEGEGAGVRR